MRQRKIFGIILFLFTVMLISGCSKKEEKKFSIGTWNDNVFENTWLNMKLEINNDWSLATDDEISELMGVGTEYLNELKGTNNKALETAAKLKTIYGFLAYSPDATNSIQLMYENLAKTLGGTKYSEKEYLDVVKEQLPQEQFELVDESTIEIAGKTFYTMEFSVYDGALIQRYLSYKLDKYMVSLLITFTPDNKEEMDEFLNNITTLED